MEFNDNKIEDIFFSLILQNRHFNSEIFKIYDLINSENISREDSIHINEKLFGFGLSEEDHEIKEILSIIRNDEIKDHLVYKLIFELIEDIFDVDDKKHLSFLLSNIKEEVETDIIYFLRDILELIYKELISKLGKKKNFIEVLSNDYLKDNELDDLLDELDVFFIDLIINLKNSDEVKNIKNKIKKELVKHDLIFHIK